MTKILFGDTELIEPSSNQDGTFTGTVISSLASIDGTRVLSLLLPAGLAQGSCFGQYYLIRCAEAADPDHWQIYFRRAVFPISREVFAGSPNVDVWLLLIPKGNDPGYSWLAGRELGQQLNITGPFGNRHEIPDHCRNLLLVSGPREVLAFLPVIQPLLDQGGRVTLLIPSPKAIDDVARRIPMAVEIRSAESYLELDEQLTQTLRWTDRLYARVPVQWIQPLADRVRRQRFSLEPGFAHVVLAENLFCGIGACLGCVVPTGNGGYTRVCVHGPVMDLTQLARQLF